MEIVISFISVFLLSMYLVNYNCVMFQKKGFSQLFARLGDTVSKDDRKTAPKSSVDYSGEEEIQEEKETGDSTLEEELEFPKYTFGEKWDIFKQSKRMWIFSAVVLLISLAFYIFRQYCLVDEPLLNIKYLILLYVYFAVAVIDAHYSIIPNDLIAFCLIFWMLLIGISVGVEQQSLIALAKYSGYGALFGGGILFACRILMRNSLGYGDIKLMVVTGLICGFFKTFNILFYSMLVMFFICVYLLITKKANRHAKIPMGPFLLAGYILAGLFGV